MHHQTRIMALAGLVVCLNAQMGLTQDRSALVYYQVTDADGNVTDQFQPPQTNKKIVSVVRISRFDSPRQQGRMVSTETGVTRYNAPRLVQQDMQWEGGAWVVPSARTGQKDHAEAIIAKAILAEVRRVGTKLKAARAGRQAAQSNVQDAEAIARQLKGKPAYQAAQRQLDQARANLKQVVEQIKQLEGALDALVSVDKPLPAPTGKVGQGGLGGPLSAGIAKPIDQLRVLSHRVQVWPMAKATGLRTIKLSMAHPEAGQGGAFCYVAYADTDADGKPDSLIARSPLVQVSQGGKWSHWDFQTDKQAVFVGNAWPGSNSPVYCRKLTNADMQGNWTGLGSEVWVSGFFGANPDQRFWPYLSNIRVRVSDAPIRRADHQIRQE